MKGPSALNMDSGGAPVNTTSNNVTTPTNNTRAKGDAKNQANWVKNSFGTVVRDIRGRPITIGKHVAYAVRSGCVAEMKIGKVLGLTENGKLKVQVKGGSRPSILNSFSRLVAIS